MTTEKISPTDEKVVYNLKPVPTDGSVGEPAQVHEEPIEIDPVMEARVRRKIDMVILPIFGFIFMFQYLDKIALSYAVIFGMKTDLNLQGQDYSWCNSIFCKSKTHDLLEAGFTDSYILDIDFGQFFFEYPAVYLLHRFPIKKFVGVTILVWGTVMMTLAATTNFSGLMAGRFFLGASEGAVSPAFVIMTSIFWRKKEHPLRLACFVSMNAFAQVAGGLLLYGCGSITNASIDGWRISFLLAGGITILLGGVFMWIVPVSPGTAWFLTAEERVVAQQRVAQEHASAQHDKFQWDQAIATLKDVKFWLIFLWALMITITSVVVFGSLVISGLGFDRFKTILIGLPGPGIQFTTIWIGVIACKFFPNQRGIVQTLLLIVPLTGVIILKKLPYENSWGLVGGYWMATANSSVFVINMSMIASNSKGHTRKSMMSIIYFIGYALGSIIAPQLFRANEAPLYPTAMNTIIAMYCVFITAQIVYRQLCARENARRDRLWAEGSVEAEPGLAPKEDNRTDIEDLGFRYVL